MKLSIKMLCHYVECHCAKCRVLFTTVLNDIMLSVVMLNVFMPSVLAPLYVVHDETTCHPHVAVVKPGGTFSRETLLKGKAQYS
jgi:hypothetical protein